MLKETSGPQSGLLCGHGFFCFWGPLIKPAVAYAHRILDHVGRKVELNLENTCFVPGCETPLSLCVCHD